MVPPQHTPMNSCGWYHNPVIPFSIPLPSFSLKNNRFFWGGSDLPFEINKNMVPKISGTLHFGCLFKRRTATPKCGNQPGIFFCQKNSAHSVPVFRIYRGLLLPISLVLSIFLGCFLIFLSCPKNIPFPPVLGRFRYVSGVQIRSQEVFGWMVNSTI